MCADSLRYSYAETTFQGSTPFFVLLRRSAGPHIQLVTLVRQDDLCRRTQCDMSSVWDDSVNGEFNHRIINGFGVQPVIHDSVLYSSGSSC